MIKLTGNSREVVRTEILSVLTKRWVPAMKLTKRVRSRWGHIASDEQVFDVLSELEDEDLVLARGAKREDPISGFVHYREVRKA